MIESKRKAIIFFVLAAILAGTAGFLTLSKVKELNNDLGTMVKVYAAKGDIASRSIITPKDVTVEEIPKKFLTDQHITSTDDLQNKVSVIPLSAGDFITKNMLKQASAVMEENNRLITLMASDRVFFDEELEALDRVDIIVSVRFDNENKTQIFMKDVKVARVANDNKKFAGVQLEVSLEQAPKLIHMQNYADSVRIIKANVGAGKEDPPETDTAAETEAAKEPAEKAGEKPKEEKPKAEEKKEADKKEQDDAAETSPES
ncbi:flagellar basal body P-ring biosynthesis protein FlgA [Planococcus massiliensis]|uniref:Flagellar basal body P-ring biosynthesis protein FlgA n=1 Tax=Planococcus massiliensis TaxID=1499687 RepID=A0A098EKV1_9BACL|nr:SAF domain-containing protein [Planococcus massiliensis]CEG21796.1 flagellar basal body P-ring biosynthesis protein FlgA [Planococcus massiliensis]